MACYSFEIIDHGASRHVVGDLQRTRVTTELPDREAARDFAIEMAESVMGECEGSGESHRSLIAITDETGEVLDTIHSVWV